jgi:sodium/potassium-transporting ATPase subunit alpha
LRDLARQFTHFLALLLWLAAGLAFMLDYIQPGQGLRPLGTAIVAVVVINAIFAFAQEYKAERASMALRALLPDRAVVVRRGATRVLEARDVVPGDLIVVREGDRVAADARLIEASALKVNNASLTGESETLLRHSLPDEQANPLEASNLIFAGTTVLSGWGKAVVFATGRLTEFGKIATLTAGVISRPSPLQVELARVSRTVAVLSLLIGGSFFLLGRWIGRTFWENFVFAIGIIVANVPEGLLPTVTLSLSMAAQRMARRNALVKDLPAVEALGSTTVICTDKTGTITQNRMEVREIFTQGRSWKISRAEKLLTLPEELFWAFLYCHDLVFESGMPVGDPIESALYRLATERLTNEKEETRRLLTMPFDPERKLMSVVQQVHGDSLVLTKGAVERIVDRSTAVLMDGYTKDLDNTHRQQILNQENAFAEAGFRVLGFGFRTVALDSVATDQVESDLVFCGMVALADPLRPEVPNAIRRCTEAGIRVIMITGDHRRTAAAVGREIGLIAGDAVIYDGAQIDAFSDDDLRNALVNGCRIFARANPRQKLRIVQILRSLGEIVAVTGDGVNDAPALKEADIGVAMGLAGTDVARESADMVLLDDNFATIVVAVEEGRTIFQNIRNFITYIFTSNVPEIVPYLAYVLLGIPLPLTILQILAVDLGTDMVPALALGADPPNPEIMKLKPRARSERLLNKSILMRAYLFLGLIESAAAMTCYFFVLYSGGWKWGATPTESLYRQATTACLTAIIVTQVANVLVCRSPSASAFSFGVRANALLVPAIAVEIALLLALVYSALGQKIFATAPLPLAVWVVAVPFFLVLLIAEEVRKKYYVRRSG